MEGKVNRLGLEGEPNRMKQPPKLLARALLSVRQTNVFQGGVVTQEGFMDRIWITFKAEKEKWTKSKANPCHVQESNLFRPAVLWMKHFPP